MFSFARHTLIGLVAGLLILSIFVGGPDKAFFILFGVVACSAGLALVYIIPAAYLIGLVIHYFFTLLFKSPGIDATQTVTPQPIPTLSKPRLLLASLTDEIAITEYIRKRSASGDPWPDIKCELVSAGWSDQLIDQIHSKASFSK